MLTVPDFTEILRFYWIYLKFTEILRFYWISWNFTEFGCSDSGDYDCTDSGDYDCTGSGGCVRVSVGTCSGVCVRVSVSTCSDVGVGTSSDVGVGTISGYSTGSGVLPTVVYYRQWLQYREWCITRVPPLPPPTHYPGTRTPTTATTWYTAAHARTVFGSLEVFSRLLLVPRTRQRNSSFRTSNKTPKTLKITVFYWFSDTALRRLNVAFLKKCVKMSKFHEIHGKVAKLVRKGVQKKCYFWEKVWKS